MYLLLLLSALVECKKEKKPCACVFYTQENITQVTQKENVTVVAVRINLNQTNYKPCAIQNVVKKTKKLLKKWESTDNRKIEIVPFLVEGSNETVEKPEVALLDYNGTVIAKEVFEITVKEENITAENEVNATQSTEEEKKEEKVEEKQGEAAEGEEKKEEEKKEEEKEEEEKEEESEEKSEKKKDKKKGKKDKKKEKKDKKDKKEKKKGKKDKKKEKKDKKSKKEKKPKVEVVSNFQETLQSLLNKEKIEVDFVKLSESKKDKKKEKKQKKEEEQAPEAGEAAQENENAAPETANVTTEL